MVEIFDDRVEIYNPGGLPKGLPPSEFGKRSVCRNPLIASLLLRCEYIERMGTGMDRIHDNLKNEHCPPVDIRYNTMFTLEFKRPTYIKQNDQLESSGEKAKGETRVKTRVKTRGETREKILKLISGNPQITIPQLADKIGITIKGIEWQINRLKKDGLLKRVGPSKGGKWEVVKK